MSYFNEHAFELFIMELFQQEGYTYTSGEEIHKEVNPANRKALVVKNEK